ncbi:glutamate cyclase domain-containing protein [Falsiroseomonas sp. HW251]|uniref:glutamate cyclase domain-containing protein n=1 Tax=Falsiroseomonas sp. HW251 TaxID=3390998 RepID=UPI003D31319E
MTTDFTGEALDQLVTLEIKNAGMPRGVLRPLYDAARALAGGPIASAVADALLARVKPGDAVILLTGAGYMPTMPKGESDGPPGAAALARILHKGLGAVPVFAVEAHHAEVMAAAATASSLSLRPLPEALETRMGAVIAAAPAEQHEADAWMRDLVATLRPAAVIAIERLAPGEDGAIYAARGLPLSGPNGINRGVTDISAMMSLAAGAGALTIGIGDHGNEAGFGAIRETTVAVMPHGAKLATTVGADFVFPAANANWGSYAVEAALACRLGDAGLMHTPAVEDRVLRRCFEAGVLEAMAFSAEFLVDGLEGETSVAVVQILGNIVRKHLERPAGYAGRKLD